MKDKSLLLALGIPTLLLLVPLTAMRFTREVVWTGIDFTVAWILMAAVGLSLRVLLKRSISVAYRLGAAIAVGAAFLLTWCNLAVGFIGNESNPANLLYFGVVLIEFTGICLARFAPAGLARALFATAVAQALVPVIALLVWRVEFTDDVALIFLLNFVFVLLFVMSALLFRRAARPLGRTTHPAIS